MLMELEEDEWEWEQPEPSQLKLGNTRGAGLKSNKGYPAPKKQKFLPSKGGGLYGQGDPMFVSGNKPLGKPCKHVMQPVEFKWGNESVTVYATAGRSNYDRKGNVPDFGLYLDSIWAKAPARNEFINWPDFKTPAKPELAAIQIVDAFIRACKGERVEVGCIGAHGRTGTVLACMGVLAGQQPEDAIDYIRSSYCHHAVETKDQELWVQWFHDYFFKEGSK
jgi:protein-tyrosine phosphatase